MSNEPRSRRADIAAAVALLILAATGAQAQTEPTTDTWRWPAPSAEPGATAPIPGAPSPGAGAAEATPGAEIPGAVPGATPTGAGPRQIAPWLSRALESGAAEAGAETSEGGATAGVRPLAPPEAVVPDPVVIDPATGLATAPGDPLGAPLGAPSAAPRPGAVAGAAPGAASGAASGAIPGAPVAGAGVPGATTGATAGARPGAGAGAPPLVTATPTADAPAAVSVAPLDRVDIGSAGLIDARSAGLPEDAWRGATTDEAIGLIDGLRPTNLHTANRLTLRLLLAGLKPPADGAGATVEEDLLAARLRALSRFGAVNEAARLAETAGSDRIRAASAAALVSGRDGALCDVLMAGTESSLERIYCLAVRGDVARAELSIRLARDLATPDQPADAATLSLLEAMTDPLLAEFAQPPRAIDDVTPLKLAALRRLRAPLPGDFARAAALSLAPAALAPEFPPRQRIEALERLEASGAVDTRLLAEAYRGTPSAESGGVWGRVEAYRRVIGAGQTVDGRAYAQAVLTALARAEEAGQGAVMSRLLARDAARRVAALGRDRSATALSALPRDPALRRLLRLGGEAEAASLLLAAAGPDTAGPEERALDRLAAPGTPGVWNPSDAEALLARAARSDAEAGRLMAGLNAFGFSTPAPTLFPEPASLPRDIAAGRIAPAILGALRRLSDGTETQPETLYAALVTLIEFGFENEARQIVIEAVLIGR